MAGAGPIIFSWVKGYENILGPMEKVSALFNEKVLARVFAPSDPRYSQCAVPFDGLADQLLRYGARRCGPITVGKSAAVVGDILSHDF